MYSSWVLFLCTGGLSKRLQRIWFDFELRDCFRTFVFAGQRSNIQRKKRLIVLHENWYKQIGVDLRRVPKSEGTVTIHSFLLDSSRFALDI